MAVAAWVVRERRRVDVKWRQAAEGGVMYTMVLLWRRRRGGYLEACVNT